MFIKYFIFINWMLNIIRDLCMHYVWERQYLPIKNTTAFFREISLFRLYSRSVNLWWEQASYLLLLWIDKRHKVCKDNGVEEIFYNLSRFAISYWEIYIIVRLCYPICFSATYAFFLFYSNLYSILPTLTAILAFLKSFNF